jgi:hypothetical protein
MEAQVRVERTITLLQSAALTGLATAPLSELGTGDGTRTRTSQLKGLPLCLSSSAGMFARLESNQRMTPSKAECLSVLATRDRLVWAVGFEPTISSFRRTQDDQLPYAQMVAVGGFEPPPWSL